MEFLAYIGAAAISIIAIVFAMFATGMIVLSIGDETNE